MAQHNHRYIVASVADGVIKIEATGFDSDTQAETAAIELAEGRQDQTFQVYEVRSVWRQVNRVERVL